MQPKQMSDWAKRAFMLKWLCQARCFASRCAPLKPVTIWWLPVQGLASSRPGSSAFWPDPLAPKKFPIRRWLSHRLLFEKDPEDTNSLVKKALDNRPEMAAVRSLIQSAGERVKSARGGLLPKVAASAWSQWDSEDLSKNAESWMVGIQATWPIFEGGATVSKIREARNHLKEIEARGKEVALDIALEVNQAALAVQEATEKMKVAEERKQWAEKALEEVRNLYRNQVVAVDSLLQAELAWNQAEVSYTPPSLK